MTRVYRPKVRVNNWFEDLCLEQEKVEAFQRKRSENQLLIEKTRRLFDNFHQKVDLEAPKEHIRFGAVVQLMPTRMNICEDPNVDLRPALSVNISGNAVRHSERIGEECDISVAPSLRPYVRNSFRITSVDMAERPNEFLKYGQQFHLACVDTEKNPLLLYASPKAIDLSTSVTTNNFSYKRGEINVPLGLIRYNNCGAGKAIPMGHTNWYCQHIDPRKHFESEGNPVPSNKPIVITHLATNKNLAAENVVIQTLFGPEYLASVQDYRDTCQRYQWQNVWMISNGSQ